MAISDMKSKKAMEGERVMDVLREEVDQGRHLGGSDVE